MLTSVTSGAVLVPISLFGESVEGGRERCIDGEAETCYDPLT